MAVTAFYFISAAATAFKKSPERPTMTVYVAVSE